jgi:actin-like ATPase involved in cell morphogenesis
MLRGLDKRQKTDLPVYIAEDPLRAVVEELNGSKTLQNLRAF